MAKKAKKTNGMKGIILSVLAIVFGVVLFSTMFMPLIAAKESDEAKISAVNVMTAMTFANEEENFVQNAKDLANASEEERAAYTMISIQDENLGAKFKAAAFFNLFASIFGGLLAVCVILSMIFKAKILRIVSVCIGALATMFAIAALVCVLVFLGGKTSGIVEISDFFGIHAASILAIITGAFSAMFAWAKK